MTKQIYMLLQVNHIRGNACNIEHATTGLTDVTGSTREKRHLWLIIVDGDNTDVLFEEYDWIMEWIYLAQNDFQFWVILKKGLTLGVQ